MTQSGDRRLRKRESPGLSRSMFAVVYQAFFRAVTGLCLLAPAAVLMGGPSLLVGNGLLAAEEPPALNPFAPVKQDRDDALPGYLEMSDGTVYVGSIYMTRDKPLKLEDRQGGGDDVRQWEVPLRVVRQIECRLEKEWMEKEWRFKEAALNEKVYTGRTYPARVYAHTVTLKDGRKLSGSLGEIIYVRPFASHAGPRADQEPPEPQRFLLHKRDKGEIGKDLRSLLYVRLVKLGPDALDEGRQKAAKQAGKSQTKGKPAAGKKGTARDTNRE